MHNYNELYVMSMYEQMLLLKCMNMGKDVQHIAGLS